MIYLKKNIGVDISYEVVQALKTADYNHALSSSPSSFVPRGYKIVKYNPQWNGHHFLLNIQTEPEGHHAQVKNTLVVLNAKNSFLSDQKSLNMYEHKKQVLSQTMAR